MEEDLFVRKGCHDVRADVRRQTTARGLEVNSTGPPPLAGVPIRLEPTRLTQDCGHRRWTQPSAHNLKVLG